MRYLTAAELASETLHRHALRLRRSPNSVERELVELIAEMIELGHEQVPDCYVQATLDPTPATRPGRRAFACATCGGTGYVMQVACPDCQGPRA